jgi:Na+/H+-dicarboxylate symporter
MSQLQHFKKSGMSVSDGLNKKQKVSNVYYVKTMPLNYFVLIYQIRNEITYSRFSQLLKILLCLLVTVMGWYCMVSHATATIF